MITTHAYYLVAYPHPTVLPTRRIKRLKLDSDAVGTELLGLLRDSYPDHSGDLDNVTLWKASVLASANVSRKSSDEIYKWLHEHGPGVAIPREHTMAMVFPEGPHEAKERQIDIVAMTPEIVEAMELQADVDGNLRHMKARAELAKTLRTTDSPSEIAKNPASIRDIVKAPSGPRYGRPSDHSGPPTALFSPELALLKYDLEHLDVFMPDPMAADLIFRLIENATDFFDDENGRKVVLRPILRGLLEGYGDRRMTNTYGTWLEETFGRPIIEINDEPGLGGDPFLRGLVAYSEAIAQETCHPFLGQSNLPVVILAVAGNQLVVSTAVYTDSIYADELLSLSLRFGSHAADNALHVGRVFVAIKRCAERLRSLYRNLGTSTRSTLAAKVLWPNPTSDPPGSTEGIPELEFFSKVDRFTGNPIGRTVIDEENKCHAMYLARMRTEDGTTTMEVFVKFAVNYNATAHRLLANYKPPLAPALHSCTRVIGDMFMVVMEYLPGASLLDVLLPLPASVQETIRRDVPLALDILHERDFVFGDLREANLLYLQEDGGRALLVDFDRVGRDGEDRYSACLSPDAGLGVDRLQIMEKSHDIENFGRLMDRLSRL